jgi:hypothetical protein
MAQVFVRASARAKSYYRGTSRLAKATRILGVPKERLVESHAYQQFKKAQETYNASRSGKNFSKMARKQFRHSKLTKLRKVRLPNYR